MSLVSAKTMPYGPAKLDLQIEQGADFALALTLFSPAVPALAAKGKWLSGTTYAVGDAVFYSSALYIAIASNVGAQPDTSSASWQAAAPWDLTGATIDAHAQLTAPAPPGRLDLGATITNPTGGQISLSLSAAASGALAPFSQTFRNQDVPPVVGSWVLRVTQGGGTLAALKGLIYMDRDPCLT